MWVFIIAMSAVLLYNKKQLQTSNFQEVKDMFPLCVGFLGKKAKKDGLKPPLQNARTVHSWFLTAEDSLSVEALLRRFLVSLG